MADVVQNILVNFEVDSAGLDPAVDQLERLGAVDKKTADAFKATTAELNKRQSALNSTAKAQQQAAGTTKKSIDDLNKAVNTFTQDFIEGFQEGVQEELRKAGVSAEEFSEALKTGQTEVSKSSEGLKIRLRGIAAELAVMKERGEENTQQYKDLVKEAGNLNDALQDVRQEIRNAGSDTAVFDGLISAAQGIAGGFAVAQGAAALFGDESEELQETLLKVNAAMAILQGLQSIQTVLQKESAAATLLQTVGQKIYNVVIGESIGLMAAFRIALAATGVGLLILGIAALVNILNEQEKALERVNAALDANKNAIDADREAIERLAEEEQARAEAAGALESELISIRGRSLLQQRASIEESTALLARQREEFGATTQEFMKLNAAITENNDKIKEIDNKIILEGINLVAEREREALQAIADTASARLAATRKNSAAELSAAKSLAIAKANVELNEAGKNVAARLAIEANLQRELRSLQRAFDQVRQQDRISGIEAALAAEQSAREGITVRQGQAEIDLQKRLIREKANLELLQEGLTANQVLAIKTNAQAEQLKLQREFNRQTTQDVLEDMVSRNNAELAQLDITNRERLNLTIDNIITTAAIEIEQNRGKVDKIKEIEAKRDADIKAARLASIQQTLNEEIALREATGGVDTRADEKLLAAQDQIRAAGTEREKRAIEERLNVRRLGLQEEFNLIDQVADRERSNIDLRLDALNNSFEQGLISFKDYNLQYEDLTDQQAEITEDAEQKKRDAIVKTQEAQRQATIRAIDQTVEYTQQVSAIFESFASNAQAREQNNIDAQRQRIEDLRKDGKISEQESEARMKKLDNAEKRLRIQQAQREKRLAIFNATIGIAAGIAKTIANVGFPAAFPLIAIAAVLGAAQIAAIASRPIPQFRKGKKDAYEGPGVVGEAGAELIEKDGQLYVAPKKTIIWLGAKDKVFNPQETIRMMEKPGLQAARVERVEQTMFHGERLDYTKLGKVIASSIPHVGINLDADGITQYMRGANSHTTYYDRRRSWGK